MNFVKELWRGEVSLSTTFWGMGVLINFAFSAFDGILNWLGFYDVITDITVIFTIIIAVITLLYSLFISICIWRSATKYITDKDVSEDEDEDGTWGYWAKVIVVLGWVLLSFQLFVWPIMLSS